MAILSSISITILFLILFIVMIIASIIRRRWKILVYSSIPFLLFLIAGVTTSGLLVKKSYQTIKTFAKSPFKRSGIELYEALFEKGWQGCVDVKNNKDQYIPGLDCCIWMEFTTCPQELQRILKQEKYSSQTLISDDLKLDFFESPDWWQPKNLGDSVLFFSYDLKGQRLRSIISSADSTRILYCDMLY